jgi:hypothetical protein
MYYEQDCKYRNQRNEPAAVGTVEEGSAQELRLHRIFPLYLKLNDQGGSIK